MHIRITEMWLIVPKAPKISKFIDNMIITLISTLIILIFQVGFLDALQNVFVYS